MIPPKKVGIGCKGNEVQEPPGGTQHLVQPGAPFCPTFVLVGRVPTY